MSKKQFILAGPSCVIPGRIPENVSFLKDLVSEIGLTFFDSRGSLEYTRADLPKNLAVQGLKYHVHLPLDLDWTKGADHVFQVARALAQKVWFLGPDKFVLHPPDSSRDLEELALLWIKNGFKARQLLVENIKGNDLSGLWPVIEATGLGVCLDIGHLMAYHQVDILKKDIILDRTSLVHVYGKEDHTGHKGLSVISREGETLLRQILSGIKEGSSVLVEVFEQEDFLDSRDILIHMADSWGMEFV
ncbi:MAG: cobamide remodeling phosphodiesterase CbiR [Desulfonatronovibrio sp.]